MKALVFRRYGSPADLSVEEIPPPRLGERDVLVRVRAASVNSWDRDNLLGKNRFLTGVRRPKFSVLGGDIAGVVDAVGPAVTRFSPGDGVMADLCASGWGAFAELARAPERILTSKPPGLGFSQAAAMPQAAVIALQGIRDHGRVVAGMRVLVNGAGGGVGTFAVQLAKNAGAEVTAVDAASKLDMLTELGADHVVDYRAQDYARLGRQFDFVLDCELHRSPLECLDALAPRGRLTVVGGSTWPIVTAVVVGRLLRLARGRQMGLLLHEPNKDLDYMARLASEGRLHPVIEREYRLAEAPDALQRMCDGAVLGKAVIAMP